MLDMGSDLNDTKSRVLPALWVGGDLPRDRPKDDRSVTSLLVCIPSLGRLKSPRRISGEPSSGKELRRESSSSMKEALSPKDWILALHQIVLILLIVGKWLMSIGVNVTKDELSQLLLTFMGTATDILEFTSETISDVNENNPQLVYIILGIWTWSMLQFPLHLSVVNPKTEEASENVSFLRRHQTDLWNIVQSLLIQDGPFLLVRIVVMAHFNFDLQMLFFIIKNFLVVTLNFYRLYVIFLTYRQPK